MPDSKKKAVVYVLTNPAFADHVKVGTTTNLAKRLKDLDNTSVPLPFRCEFAVAVEDAAYVERHVHQAFADHRTRNTREFFEVNPQRIISALKIAGGRDVTPKEDIAADAEGIKALDRATRNRSRSSRLIPDAGLQIGDTLRFAKNEAMTAEVVGEKAVLFEGRETSVSAAALTLLHRAGYKWTTASGFQYWMFQDETLAERAKRLQEERQEDDEGAPEVPGQAEAKPDQE